VEAPAAFASSTQALSIDNELSSRFTAHHLSCLVRKIVRTITEMARAPEIETVEIESASPTQMMCALHAPDEGAMDVDGLGRRKHIT
jgi:hypothetical protein